MENFLIINERNKKSDWTKFKNNNQNEQNRNQNGSVNIMYNFKNYSLKDKNAKPMYLNKLNKNIFSMIKSTSNQK